MSATREQHSRRDVKPRTGTWTPSTFFKFRFSPTESVPPVKRELRVNASVDARVVLQQTDAHNEHIDDVVRARAIRAARRKEK